MAASQVIDDLGAVVRRSAALVAARPGTVATVAVLAAPRALAGCVCGIGTIPLGFAIALALAAGWTLVRG